MENGVQALKIAFSILIFVIAITITISAFTTTTQALNRIFTMKDADKYVTDAEGNYLNFVEFDIDTGTRKVGVETIVPAIYRAYKENYAIYFYDSSGNPMTLYETKKDGKAVEVKCIDLEQENHASPEKAIENINKLLYESCELDSNGLYTYLKKHTFIEKLGEYYMDDILGETGAAEINKTKKRVIVYTQDD